MLYAIKAKFFGKTARIITERKEKADMLAHITEPGDMELKICQTPEEAYAFAYDFTDEERNAIYDGIEYNYFKLSDILTDAEDIMRGIDYFRIPLDDSLRTTLSRFLDDVHTPGDYPADELYELDKSVVEMNTDTIARRHAQEWEDRRQFILSTAKAVQNIAGKDIDPFDDYGHMLIETAQNTLLDKLK